MEQGLPQALEPAAGQGLPTPEPAAPLVETPEPAAPIQSGQGQPPSDPATHFQSLYNKQYAENLKLQLRLEEAQRQQAELLARMVSPQQPQGNPYDPQTQAQEWWAWEKNDMANRAAERASQASQQQFSALLQQAMEMDFQQKHSDVDVSAVKAFAQTRGIRNLEDAYILMTYTQRMAGVAQNASQLTLQQFRQPTGAEPLRGGQATAIPPTAESFAETLKAYTANPAIYNSWTPEKQAAFDKELFYRAGNPS